MAGENQSWLADNQRALVAALAEVKALLEVYANTGPGGPPAAPNSPEPEPRALRALCSNFELSPFERSVLLLCAGMELDASFAGLCARANGDAARPWPTFSLALAALPGAHWSAVTPMAPLRRWRLIELSGGPVAPVTSSPLRIDERTLHYLAGIDYLDERLAAHLDPVRAQEQLVPSHREIARRIGAVLSTAPQDGLLPIPQVFGGDEFARRAIAASICGLLGVQLMALAADTIPTGAAEMEALLRLLERESALSSFAICVEADSLEGGPAPHVARFLERCRTVLILSSRDRWKPMRRPLTSVEVPKPTREEQRTLWQEALSGTPLTSNGQVHHLVSQFNLGMPAILASARMALEGGPNDDLAARVWDCGREQARPRMEDLAQRIESSVSWEDLALPEHELSQLRDISAHVRNRATVYDTWGFAAKSSRGLGISALFAGASGTGKTMAAEVLANDLRLDLYRIDLSSVVSKYIGETEKNLRRVFEAAEDGGAVLFFDEADALFGKRSEVKDSHDRYANIEINYLLQRMESYHGLAVLATNMKSALDTAFLRRIRFVINFPFPDEAQRAAIWERIFPSGVPRECLDLVRLSRLHLAGGSIRNMALNAAFLAAQGGEPVRMSHLAQAARSEFAKLERPLNEADLRGWQ
jgi:SpoVK/Ycf46/Vps4 family AAA+-type ATPase